MEPIDYRDALVRRWWLPLTLMLVGAVVAVLIPVHSKSKGNHFTASALIAIPPPGKNSPFSQSPVSTSDIIFFAANPQVIQNAAAAAHIKKTKDLAKDVSVAKPKLKKKKKSATVKAGGVIPPDALVVSVEQGSLKHSVALTNAFAVALRNYTNAQLAKSRNTAVAAAQAKVDNIQGQINSVNTQIANVNCGTTTADVTAGVIPATLTASLSPAATATTAPSNAPASTSTTTSTPLSGATNNPGTTTSTPPTSTSSSTTTTTQPPKPKACPARDQLQSQLHQLQGQLNTANTKVNQAQNKPTSSGIVILDKATAKGAKKSKVKSSTFSSRKARLAVGALAGLAVGILLAFLLDALDHTLRRKSRVQETFGFPVVAEIPAPPGTDPRRPRRSAPDYVVESTIPVEQEPMSPAAEAYRGLRTAILLEPLAAERMARRAANGAMPPVGPPGTTDGAPVAAPAGPEPWAEPIVPASAEDRVRQVVLMVSPRAEPSRGAVVANLAAAYAEAGDEALVITTASLRDRAGIPSATGADAGDIGPDEISGARRQTHLPGVSTLGLGWLVQGPGMLATKARSVLESARQLADVVLVESTQLTNHDVEAMLPYVDVVVVVAQYRRTRSDEARRSGEQLRRFDAPVLGVAFTNVPLRGKRARSSADPDRLPVARRGRPVAATVGVGAAAQAAASEPVTPPPLWAQPSAEPSAEPGTGPASSVRLVDPTSPMPPTVPVVGSAGAPSAPTPPVPSVPPAPTPPAGSSPVGTDPVEPPPSSPEPRGRRRRGWGRRPPGSPDDG